MAVDTEITQIASAIASVASRVAHDENFATQFADAVHRKDVNTVTSLCSQMGVTVQQPSGAAIPAGGFTVCISIGRLNICVTIGKRSAT